MLRPTRTPEEDAKLESMKADAVAQTKRWQALNTKSDISAEERTLMEEYAKRAQTMNDQAQKWVKEFTNEMQTWADRQKLASLA
jgi:polyribonucleotide nucleotidyltransferase